MLNDGFSEVEYGYVSCEYCHFMGDGMYWVGDASDYDRLLSRIRREHVREHPSCTRVLNPFRFRISGDPEMSHVEAEGRHEEMVAYIYGDDVQTTTDTEYRSYMLHLSRCNECMQSYHSLCDRERYDSFPPEVSSEAVEEWLEWEAEEALKAEGTVPLSNRQKRLQNEHPRKYSFS